MRTTVDLPDDVLERVKDIAADRRTCVSKVISEVVSNAVRPTITTPGDPISIDPRTGLKVLDLVIRLGATAQESIELLEQLTHSPSHVFWPDDLPY